MKFFCIFCLFFVSVQTAAETFTIAAEWHGHVLDYEAGDHPFSSIVRTAVLPGVTREKTAFRPGGRPYELALADSMKTSGDQLFWYFRLGSQHVFTSGSPLTVPDVQYSINRCQQRGELLMVQRVFDAREELSARGEWIGFELDAATANDVPFQDFPVHLARCVIMQRDISELFGDRAGRKLTAVGAGEFAVTEFDLKRKQLALWRIYNFKGGVHPLSAIVLKGVESERDGLTALRVGTVDLLIARQPEIRELALADDTLRLSRCDGQLLVYRKAVRIACTPAIDFESLRIER